MQEMSFHSSFVSLFSDLKLFVFGFEVFALWNIEKFNRKKSLHPHANGYECTLLVSLHLRIPALPTDSLP